MSRASCVCAGAIARGLHNIITQMRGGKQRANAHIYLGKRKIANNNINSRKHVYINARRVCWKRACDAPFTAHCAPRRARERYVCIHDRWLIKPYIFPGQWIVDWATLSLSLVECIYISRLGIIRHDHKWRCCWSAFILCALCGPPSDNVQATKNR